MSEIDKNSIMKQIQRNKEIVIEEEKKQLVEQIKNDQRQGLKERIEALTEKFKDDPTKLAILSQVAQDLQNAE